MRFGIWGGAQLCGAVVAAVATLALQPAVPAGAVTAAVVDSTVCQISSLTVQTQTAVQLVSSNNVTVNPFTLTGSGVCDGVVSGVPFAIDGTGATLGPATCAGLISLSGAGDLWVNGIPYSVYFDMIGPASGGVTVLYSTGISMASTVVSTAELDESPTSLAACAATGTNTLDYSGAAVVAFS